MFLKKLDRENILNDDIVKVIILLSLPIIFNTLISSIYNLIDAIFVSHIGEIEVASIVFIGSIDNLFKGIVLGVSAGVTTLVARYIGSNDYDLAKKYAGNAICFVLIVSILLSLASFFYSEDILYFFDATPNIVEASNVYFKINISLYIVLFFNLVYIAVKNAEGNTKVAMQINSISILIKIVLNYVLIYIFDGGLLSLSLSTLISGLIVMFYGIYDLFIKDGDIKLNTSHLKFDRDVLKFLLIVSIPIMVERMSVSYGFTAINKQVLIFGEDVLTAYGITNRINSLAFGTVTSVGTGLSIVISQNLSNNNIDRCREAIRKTFFINILFSIVLFTLVFAFRDFFAGLFNYGESSTAHEHTLNAISVISVSVIAWSVFQVALGVFTGIGRTKYNLYISLIRIYLFRLPFVWFFVTFLPNMGAYSVWYSVLLSNIATAIATLFIYFKNTKKLTLYTIDNK